VIQKICSRPVPPLEGYSQEEGRPTLRNLVGEREGVFSRERKRRPSGRRGCSPRERSMWAPLLKGGVPSQVGVPKPIFCPKNFPRGGSEALLRGGFSPKSGGAPPPKIGGFLFSPRWGFSLYGGAPKLGGFQNGSPHRNFWGEFFPQFGGVLGRHRGFKGGLFFHPAQTGASQF